MCSMLHNPVYSTVFCILSLHWELCIYDYELQFLHISVNGLLTTALYHITSDLLLGLAELRITQIQKRHAPACSIVQVHCSFVSCVASDSTECWRWKYRAPQTKRCTTWLVVLVKSEALIITRKWQARRRRDELLSLVRYVHWFMVSPASKKSYS